MLITDRRSPFIKLDGTENNETIYAYFENSVIHGGGGNDTLNGSKYSDQLYGEEGDDNLSGQEGNDLLNGGLGHDTLAGGNGDDSLYGGEGNDTINGEGGNDVLDGGLGNDELYGGLGDDVYVFGKDHGQDTISDGDGLNVLKFEDGIKPEELLVIPYYKYSSNDVQIINKNTGDSVIIKRFRDREEYQKFTLEFDNKVSAQISKDGKELICKEATNSEKTNESGEQNAPQHQAIESGDEIKKEKGTIQETSEELNNLKQEINEDKGNNIGSSMIDFQVQNLAQMMSVFGHTDPVFGKDVIALDTSISLFDGFIVSK